MALSRILRIPQAIRQRWVHAKGNRRWRRLSSSVNASFPRKSDAQPVIFFNASTRLAGVSQNAAYARLTSMGLRSQGIPVIQFVCRGGLHRCVLGSDRDHFEKKPPCAACVRQSEALFDPAEIAFFDFEVDETLALALEGLGVSRLAQFQFHDLPLGFWATNSLRWMLRRYNLQEDLSTRSFMQSIIHSAWNIYQKFEELAEQTNPQAVVVFNGMFYPEAVIRHICLQRGIRVITHEVGVSPLSAFFSHGEATTYAMTIPEDFQLTPEMNATLDEALNQRFKGNFSMAGIRFWPEMKQLDEPLASRMALYRKIVPVFTNVIFDTSQVHANSLFADMFQWLDAVSKAILEHPDVFFVIRAHPDESRPGKASRESVADWVKRRGLLGLPNVAFVDADQYLSSYELIRRAHFILNYNSTVGLEGTLLGKPVLTAGKARYTQIPTTYFPQSRDEYLETLEKFLTVDEIDVPDLFIVNARRILFLHTYVTSLPFGGFVQEDGVWKGYVIPRKFEVGNLLPEQSETMRILSEGILHGSEFRLQYE